MRISDWSSDVCSSDLDGLADSYLKHYGLSKQFYSFDSKNVHVLTMATEGEFEAGSEQYNFVVNDLRKAANNPDTKWIIVTMQDRKERRVGKECVGTCRYRRST